MLEGGRGRERRDRKREREKKEIQGDRERDKDCRHKLAMFFNYLEPNEVFALNWETLATITFFENLN